MLDPLRGVAVAEQQESLDAVRVTTSNGQAQSWPLVKTQRFVAIPMGGLGREMDRDPGALKVVVRAILRRRGVLAAAIIATIVVNLIALATSLFSMQVYDRVIPRNGLSTLWALTFGIGVALFLDFALRSARGLMIEKEAAEIDAEVSEHFLSHAIRVRSDAVPSGVGTLAAQLRGWEQIRSLLSSGFVFLIADLPFAIFFIVVIAALGGAVAAAPLIAFPLALLLAVGLTRLIQEDTAKAVESGNRKNGLLVEIFDSLETLKANRAGWSVMARWGALLDVLRLHEEPVKRWSTLSSTLFGSLQQATYVAVVAWGAVLVGRGDMTMGALIACSILAGRVNGPLITQLPSFLVQWGYARSSLKALDAITRLPLERPAGKAALNPVRLRAALSLRDVSFAYPGERTALEGLNLDIRPGERVAVIGGVGSGKSTLLKLMAGLYAPSSGRVLIDDLDSGLLADESIRRTIGYLAQQPRLLAGTLRDNLFMGLDRPDEDLVIEAVRELGLSSIIAGQARGLDLEIGEGGRGLSGGQTALVGLARTFLAHPPIWLLDEPTASLDQATEASVIQALDRRVGKDSTLILATHRMQLLPLCQRVVILRDGRIAMDGSVEEVLDHIKRRPERPTPAARKAR
ncbi:MAG: ATP-binding cassette domain-containing protein [Brevundimonas sp.]